MTVDTRALAAQAVAGVLGGKSLNHALEPALCRVAAQDRGLLQQLCYGTLREAPKLEALLKELLDRPLRRKDADVQALLMIGLHQLLSLRIPDHAAVASTVDAAATLNKRWATGLVNAVLRRFQREQDTLVAALDAPAAASHPDWLYGKIRKQWPEHAQQIIDTNNAPPPMTLRVNRSRMDRAAYLERLAEAGIEARAGLRADEAITLAQPVDVEALPGFVQGDVSVQDESAQLAAHLLDAQPGERVLDACAAPGGKTCHILERTPQLESLTALDIDASRLARVGENLDRLGLTATLRALDATEAAQALSGETFDRILIDAPCSASGVIRRHPDIKVLRRPSDIASFAQLQLQILQACWPLLAAGGTLLYATCSIFKEENQQVIAQFCAQAPEAEPVPLDGYGGVARDGGLQLIPDRDGGDGLFYARLIRRT